MAIRPIRMFGDPVLYKGCRPVEMIDDRVRLLLDDMAETMYHSGGAGLAASQIGILRRLVVMDVGEGLLKLVNPILLKKRGRQTVQEGCLSFPGVWVNRVRPSRVLAQAQDENGKTIRIAGSGLLAQCLCHELEHLDGIVLTGQWRPEKTAGIHG